MVSVIVLSFVVVGFSNLRLRRSAVTASPAARCATPKGAARDLLHHPVGHYPANHIRARRPGNPSRIDSDPEFHTFVLARIERLTCTGLADAIRELFPPHRRVEQSAIHAWWHRQSRPRG